MKEYYLKKVKKMEKLIVLATVGYKEEVARISELIKKSPNDEQELIADLVLYSQIMALLTEQLADDSKSLRQETEKEIALANAQNNTEAK